MNVTKQVSTTNDQDVTTQTTVLTRPMYELGKKLVQVVLPAFSALYFGLSQIWGLPAGEEVVGTTALFTTFLGVTLGVSSARYNDSDAPHSGEIIVTEDQGGVKGWLLALDGDPEQLGRKDSVSFKIRKNQTYDPTP